MPQRRRTKAKRRLPAIARPTSRGVSRREYAELVLRLGSVELQVQRNRAEIELHTQRIAQLQDTMDALKIASPSSAFASDLPALTTPPKPTVES